jgi:hypothetical protein
MSNTTTISSVEGAAGEISFGIQRELEMDREDQFILEQMEWNNDGNNNE